MADGHPRALAPDAVEPGSELAFRLARLEDDVARQKWVDQMHREDTIRAAGYSNGRRDAYRRVGLISYVLLWSVLLLYLRTRRHQEDGDD